MHADKLKMAESKIMNVTADESYSFLHPSPMILHPCFAKWRFMDTGKESAFFNMAMDEAVVEEVAGGNSLPTFRLYEWKPEGITIGHSQKAGDILDYDRCVRDGIVVTRRLTGGRAVFHDREIAYSVVGYIRDPRFGGNLSDSYRKIGEILLDALRTCGAAVDLERGTLSEREGERISRSLPCFLSTSRFEITCRGRKVIGSAQRRFRNVFLQHGSILTGSGHERIADYVKECHDRDRLANLMNRKSISLCDATGCPVDTESLKTSLYESFAAVVGGTVRKEYPSNREMEYTRRSMNERYSSKGWILGYE